MLHQNSDIMKILRKKRQDRFALQTDWPLKMPWNLLQLILNWYYQKRDTQHEPMQESKVFVDLRYEGEKMYLLVDIFK